MSFTVKAFLENVIEMLPGQTPWPIELTYIKKAEHLSQIFRNYGNSDTLCIKRVER